MSRCTNKMFTCDFSGQKHPLHTKNCYRPYNEQWKRRSKQVGGRRRSINPDGCETNAQIAVMAESGGWRRRPPSHSQSHIKPYPDQMF
ncbi:uncharacterized protein LOC143913963 isoform X2 [Arctopsyche grandis]|uniref:uncharacterized protein LOC143913963 isoform X2 n=1 Tax=Arctopsyche grandis TaxID=121162 RepID=UPI00406D6749